MKYYSATDSGKLQIARRGDHWSPHFKLFKLFFRYKITSRTDSKACPPCAREGGVSIQRTPGGLLKTTFRYKTVIGLKLQNNPSGFSYEKPPPFTKGRQGCGFLDVFICIRNSI